MNIRPHLPGILAALMMAIPAASAQNAGPEITELRQTLAEVPKSLLGAIRASARKEASATEATDLLRTKVEGRTATLKLKVDKVEKYQRKNEKVDRYRIKAEDVVLHEAVINVKVFLWVHLEPGESPKVAALKKGGEVKITGKVTLAKIDAKALPELHIDVSDATLQ